MLVALHVCSAGLCVDCELSSIPHAMSFEVTVGGGRQTIPVKQKRRNTQDPGYNFDIFEFRLGGSTSWSMVLPT